MELQLLPQKKIEAEQNLDKLETRMTELLQELLSSPSDAHRDKLESELAEIKEEFTKTIANIQLYEEIIKQREKANRKIESKRLFDEAMKDGHALLHTNTIVLMGVAGSGKTSVKDLLLENSPRKERNSTSVRDRILHVRPVTSQTFLSTGNKWEEMSQDDMIKLLALAIQRLPQKLRDSLPSVPPSKRIKLSEQERDGNRSDVDDNSFCKATDPVQEAISVVVDLVVDAVSATSDSSSESDTGKELFSATTFRITDSGGQPQFQDIASLFIRHTSAGLFVMKLTDDFDTYPLDELYKDGELVGTPSLSHLSHKETIISLVRSFVSHGEKPRLIFIGTFLDKVEEKDVVYKNEMLLEMLPSDLKNEVVYSNFSMSEVIFALNACCRENTTLSVGEEIRKAIEESPSLDIKVPLWWFIIEISLQNICSILERGILKKSECTELAQQLGFTPDALEAALAYFNEMCIAHYYPEILPDIVFVDPQVPLDKVSELTQYAISLRDAQKNPIRRTTAMSSKWRRFRDWGILTVDLLSSKEFQRHYTDNIFSPTDMIVIMKKLLIIAPLTVPLSVKASLPSESEFLMPSLLRSVPPSEIEQYRVSNPSADPLLIRFLSNCIRCGVFCCLIVYLMKACGWQVCHHWGEPVLLARNCVKFQLPNDPVSVTLIDSFSYIEVHIKARPRVCKKVCPLVRSNILEGVNAASDALHYNNDKPLASFFCPHNGSTENTEPQTGLHCAKVFKDTHLWQCSINEDLDGNLEPKHTVWFDEAAGPHLLEPTGASLVDLCIRFGLTSDDIDKEVSDSDILNIYQQLEKWEELANHLGLTRAEIEVIEGKAVRDVELKRLLLLQKWKNKGIAAGTAVTYRVLIQALLKCHCSSSAISVCKLITNVVEPKQ